MHRHFFIVMFLLAIVAGCEKRALIVPEAPVQLSPGEPIQTLARQTAETIKERLSGAGITVIESMILDSHDIFPAEAFAYFESALVANLASNGITKGIDGVRLKGDLSRQQGNIVFSYQLSQDQEKIHSGSASIPDDKQLQTTLAQFQSPGTDHVHETHKEMPVPSPLAELNRVPLDVAEYCPDSRSQCSLLLLFADELVERRWHDGTEKKIPIAPTGLRSRAPSGKILKIENRFFVITNELSSPLILDENLQPTAADYPSRLPKPEPGLNSYSLMDGRFFDFAEMANTGLAVVDLHNRLSVAIHGQLASATEPVGASIHASLPYIYTSSPTLPSEKEDTLLKFRYEEGSLRLERRQKVDGAIYDILITDLNRDNIAEMLLTLVNPRGIFIEVHEPI